MKVPILEPTKPLVIEVDLLQLSDKEWREVWGDEKLRWSIAERLRRTRLARNLTREELARKARLNVATIQRIEDASGSWPNMKSLIRIAAGLDCALKVHFVAWSEFLRDIAELESGKWTPPVPFAEDKEFHQA